MHGWVFVCVISTESRATVYMAISLLMVTVRPDFVVSYWINTILKRTEN